MKQEFFSQPDLGGVDETAFLESLKDANSKNNFNERMPKVGEIIIFYPNPDDSVSRSNGNDSCAAIVTRVWSSICVNLKVIPDHGPMQDRGSVTHHTANPAGYHFKFHDEVYRTPVNPRDVVFGQAVAPTKEKSIADTFPRRSRLDQMYPAEMAIYNAMQEVEKAGADIRLTDAINLLSQAKDKVSDFIDETKGIL